MTRPAFPSRKEHRVLGVFLVNSSKCPSQQRDLKPMTSSIVSNRPQRTATDWFIEHILPRDSKGLIYGNPELDSEIELLVAHINQKRPLCIWLWTYSCMLTTRELRLRSSGVSIPAIQPTACSSRNGSSRVISRFA